MRINMSLKTRDIDLKRASPAKASKRFAACSFDFILVTVIGFLFFLASYSITTTLDSYRRSGEIVREEIKYYNEYVSSSHLIEFIDDEKKVRKDSDIRALEGARRAIYQSYITFGNAQEPDFIITENDFTSSEIENDGLHYFYIKYAKDNNLVDYKDMSESEYLFKLYKDALGKNKDMFVYDTEYEVPVLTTKVAYQIYHFLKGGNDDTAKIGEGYYNVFYDFYNYLIDCGEELLLHEESYFNNNYMLYYDNYIKQARMINIALLISILIAAIIVVLLPKLIIKNDTSIGRLLMGLGGLSFEGEKINTWIIITKSIVSAIGFSFAAVLIYMLPPFRGVYDMMMLPFIGNMRLFVIIIVISLVSLIMNSIILFTHYKRSLTDYLFKTQIVDLHYLDEGDYDDEFEGKGY